MWAPLEDFSNGQAIKLRNTIIISVFLEDHVKYTVMHNNMQGKINLAEYIFV